MPKFEFSASGRSANGPERGQGANPKSILSRQISLGGAGRGKKLPVKRSINLAEVGVRKTNPVSAAAAIVLIVLAACLFSKFLVTDRLYAMFRAQGEAARLQAELQEEYARINAYGDIEREYAHYTYSGMTKEELSLVDRSQVIQMLENELGKDNTATAWSLSGNVLTLTATGSDLQEINMLARRLETYSLVNMCSVTEAVKEEVKDKTPAVITTEGDTVSAQGQKIVRANITAYLQAEPDEENQGSQDNSRTDAKGVNGQ